MRFPCLPVNVPVPLPVPDAAGEEGSFHREISGTGTGTGTFTGPRVGDMPYGAAPGSSAVGQRVRSTKVWPLSQRALT